MADGPVLRHRRLVLEHDAAARLVVAQPVRPRRRAEHLPALDHARARIHRERPDRREIVEPHGDDRPVAPHGDLRGDPVIARVDVGLERLDAVREELHRPAQHHRERARRDLVGERVDLEAERAAHVLVDHPHAMLGNAEVPRQDVVEHVRRLARVIHGERLVRRVVVRQDDARLEAHDRVAAGVERVPVDRVGGAERGVNVAGRDPRLQHEVVPELGMDERRARRQRGLRVHHGRQRLPRDPHARAAVLGDRARLRDDGHDGLALPDGLVHGQRILRRRLHADVVLQHADPRIAVRGHLAPGHDRDHARQRGRVRGVDGGDARVGVRRAHERRVQEARHRDVVRVHAASGDEPRGLWPNDGASDVALVAGDAGRARGMPRGRRGSRRRRARSRVGLVPPPRCRAQHRLDDRVIARAAAVVPADRLADGRRIGRRVALQEIVRGEQHARRAEAALERVLRAEGLLELGDRAALGQALDRLDAAAVRLGGQHQAAAHGRAVHAHGARAAHAVLASDVRAGQPELVAEEIDEVLRGPRPRATRATR